MLFHRFSQISFFIADSFQLVNPATIILQRLLDFTSRRFQIAKNLQKNVIDFNAFMQKIFFSRLAKLAKNQADHASLRLGTGIGVEGVDCLLKFAIRRQHLFEFVLKVQIEFIHVLPSPFWVIKKPRLLRPVFGLLIIFGRIYLAVKILLKPKTAWRVNQKK